MHTIYIKSQINMLFVSLTSPLKCQPGINITLCTVFSVFLQVMQFLLSGSLNNIHSQILLLIYFYNLFISCL